MSTEDNKTIVQRYIAEVINQGRLEMIDTFFAPEMREHVKGFLTQGGSPFQHGQEEIQDIVAEGDLVMVRLLFRGTHASEFLGIKPTGKPIEITGYATYRFAKGQIAWDTICFDWLDALEQIGATINDPGS